MIPASQRVVVLIVAALAMSLLAPGSSRAQLSAGFSAASFQFNLSNPGARSLAMGGAFVGLADDATAAYANPAGLTILARPEIFFEGRTAAFELPLVAAEPIVNLADSTLQDLTGEITFETAAVQGVVEFTPLGAPDATGTTASFTSLIYPSRNWTFALYRHQLADLRAADSAVLPAITSTALMNLVTTSGSTRTQVGIDVSSLGFAVARRLTSRLSAGLTLVRNQASIDALRSSTIEERFEGPFPGSASLAFENFIRSDSSDLTLNLGLMARPREHWAVGISFRQGARFPLREEDITRTSAGVVRTESFRDAFRIPDVVSIGSSFQTTPHLVVSVEWDHIRYSDLGRPAVLPDSLAGFGERLETRQIGSFTVTDGDELRAGLEYTFWSSPVTPSLRLGIWQEPEHKVRFASSADCPGNESVGGARFTCSIEATANDGALPPGLLNELRSDVAQAVAARALELLFPKGEDLTHFTGGFGLVFDSRFQIDAAFDYVDANRYVISLSGIVQF